MNRRATGSDVLGDAIAQSHRGPVFGLLGDANLNLVDVLTAVHGIDFVACRHEHTAICASMGWAARTGRVGVATVTHGPGLFQCASGLTTAVREGIPLIIITGAIPPVARLHAQRADHATFAMACGATHLPGRAAELLDNDWALARRTALTSGPVIMDVDLRMFTQQIEVRSDTTPAQPDSSAPRRRLWPHPGSVRRGEDARPTDDDIAAAAIRLAEADKPLLLLGRGGFAARAQALGLADAVDAVVGTTLLAQGLTDGHPRDLGVIGGFSSPHTRQILADVDVVLAVGASLTRYTVDSGRLFDRGEHRPEPAWLIQIDRDARVFGDPVAVDHGLVGDASQIVQLISDHDSIRDRTAIDRARRPVGQTTSEDDPAPPSVKHPDGRQLGALPPRVTDDPDGDDPRDVIEAVEAALPRTRQVVVGVGHYSGWAALGMSTPTPADRLLPWGFGAVGVAVGSSLGMALARPERPTVCLEGDGGTLMTLSALDDLARAGAPVLVVVLDDRGFGAEAHLLERQEHGRSGGVGGGADLAWIPTPDLVAVARGLGLAAVTARGEAIGPAVRELLTKLPAVLHVPISRKVVHDEVFAALAP